MNALPNIPFDQGPPPETAPPRRWKQILGWTAAGIGILIVLLVIAVVVLLHSKSFHQYVLSQVQRRASASLGTNVQVKDFAVHWYGISPAVDLYQVVVNGAEPYASPPLLEVDHLGVQVTITSLLHRTWYLQDITVDHPVARMLVDSQGRNNLPASKNNGQSSTNIFDLGIRHAKINQGEILYNDQKSSLAADLQDVQFRSSFDTDQKAYSGTLQYTNGNLKFDKFQPIQHDLAAQFVAAPTAFTLSQAVVSTAQSRVTLTAALNDYSNPRVQATYDAVLDATHFRQTLNNPSLPLGVIRMNGSMQYQGQPGVPPLNSAVLQGGLSSNVLRVVSASFRGDIRDLQAHYKIVNGRLYVSDLGGRVLGGSVSGNMDVDLSQTQASKVNLALRGASLSELRTVSPQISNFGLGGTANVNVDASWNKSPKNLVANVTANTANASVTPSGAANSIPVTAQLNARYSAANSQLALGPSSLRTPQGALTLSGGLGPRQSMQVNLNNINLQQVATLLPPDSAQSIAKLGLSGTASFAGTVSGSTTAPKINGHLTASDVHVNGTIWPSISANLSASPNNVAIRNGQIQSSTQGRVSFDVTSGLKQWKPEPSAPLQVSVNASQLNLADLAKAAGVTVPASGIVAANISVHGSQLSPVGQGTVTLTRARVQDQPVQSAKLSFQANGSTLDGNLNLQLPGAGGAQSTFTVNPRAQTYQINLQANGIKLGELQAVKSRNMDLSGVLNLNASGQGEFKNPQLQASVQIPQLKVQNQVISGIALQGNVANHVANLSMDAQVAKTPMQARAKVNLTGNYEADATLNTPVVPLQPLLAAYAPSVAGDLNGQTEVHATLHGPLKTPKQVNAQITIPTLQVQYKKAIQLGAVNPIRIDFANGVLALQRATIRGTDTDLQIQGTVPMATSEPMSLLLLGTVNLQLAQLIDPTMTSSGQLRFNINSYGQRTDPNVEGQVEIVNANLATAAVPIGLQNGNGILTLTKDRLNIKQFTGTVGGGTVNASGGVVYRPSLQFDLALAGKGLRFLYPESVREALDANLSLTGNTQQAMLRGQVQLNQLSFTPDFDLNDFLGQFSGETAPAPSRGFAQNLQLEVAVQTTSGVHLVSRTLSLNAAANLRVTGTAAQPVILGRVNLNSGDLIFHGDRFVLQGGTIDFINPSQTQPVVNASVNTTIEQYNIYMRFDGPVERLHTNYSSDPALPPADIINLIAFGKTMEASAANPTAPGNVGAESLIASQVSSQVTNRVEKIAGISQFSIDPVLGSAAGRSNPGARITIRQRVTSNLFVTFASDVTSTQRQVIQVQYQLSPRVSISGTRDQNGGFGFDTRIRKTW